MAAPDRDLKAAIAVTRFGLGARPGEIATASADPVAFLRGQIRREGADLIPRPDATTVTRLAAFRDYQQDLQARRRAGEAAAKAGGEPQMAPDPVQEVGRILRQSVGGDFQARVQLAATTDAGFRERWAEFWANHFTVSATKFQAATIVGPFENEAIRPHVFGRFTDLLGAVESHPAMMIYLDQVQSVGPNSQAAQFAGRGGRGRGAGRGQPPGPPGQQGQGRRALGLNENLAREILELHTVGVDGGYTQGDVTEFARAMTGMSVGGPREPELAGRSIFREQTHEPGARTVMGVTYPAGGKGQAEAILTDLARKPQTARFVCGKIARHFVADSPSPALVARLERAWTASGGDLAQVAIALISAPEAWEPRPMKFKTPYEFIVSSYRAGGVQGRGLGQTGQILTGMGQRPFGAPSPKGWPEEEGAWAAPDAIVKRMAWTQGYTAQATRDRDPNVLAADALGARLTPPVATAIARSETRPEGFALLLMSPEFQRR